jgi:Protein of unknown function (DUF2934)
MVTKPESPGKKTRRKKAAAGAPELSDSAVIAVLERAQPAAGASSGIDPDVRRQLVAAEAYFFAERRGFAAGHELGDWVAAEAVVDSRLKQMQVA